MRKQSYSIILCLVVFLFHCSSSQISIPRQTEVTIKHYLIIDTRTLSETTLHGLITSIRDSDVIFIGESHNDPVAHYLELEITKKIFENRGSVAVSMEMFERDIQHIVNEYLLGAISEEFLIKDGRAWKNYNTDYKPIVEYAKHNKLPIIAANAPRRYVRIVSSKGLDKLNELNETALKSLAPLPIQAPEDSRYHEKFFQTMNQSMMPSAVRDTTQKSGTGHAGTAKRFERLTRAFHAQVVWDATMAHSIAEFRAKNPDVPVIHINGSFHSEERLGIIQHLDKLLLNVKISTITIKPLNTFPDFETNDIKNLADFIIITDGRLPRTY